ncbi:ABC transporter ATP-binding protein [Spongisporangium articulatum]|uniref:ABC transporter ATP-binding protein n=1 Tax=Spongisporangium articulatum TaxID=3362603 RepID=A0ABW8AGR8_9ACTN
MIRMEHLTKRHGDVVALDDLTLTIRPGAVTGLIGPNGAGKTTTLRLIVGLDTPTGGAVTVDGVRYADLPHPAQTLGAHLDVRSAHPGRTARSHLLGLARHLGVEPERVTEVLARTGLAGVARRRVGTFSLGMTQRLGIAGGLLGDPEVLVLDEPVNGLDTEGVRWIRGLLRALAAEGRTVLVCSHLLAELERIADHVVVLGRGRLLADAPLAAFLQNGTLEDGYVRLVTGHEEFRTVA